MATNRLKEQKAQKAYDQAENALEWPQPTELLAVSPIASFAAAADLFHDLSATV